MNVNRNQTCSEEYITVFYVSVYNEYIFLKKAFQDRVKWKKVSFSYYLLDMLNDRIKVSHVLYVDLEGLPRICRLRID